MTKSDERAQRLARFDGFETLATMSGFLASPFIFQNLGYQGNFAICGGAIGLAIIYLIFFVPEPNKVKEETEENEKKNGERKLSFIFVKNLIVRAFVILKDGFVTVATRPRKRILKILILIQLVCFTIYWLCVEINAILYLYMTLVFDGFDADDFAYFAVSLFLFL